MRFSPTGVGNVKADMPPEEEPPVQPHGCGEREKTICLLRCGNGSAPRVWGTCCLTSSIIKSSRFSPTGVGNVPFLSIVTLPVAVQPHGCGERAFSIVLANIKVGSAPRVWGTSFVRPTAIIKRRFSPTGVGNVAQTQR